MIGLVKLLSWEIWSTNVLRGSFEIIPYPVQAPPLPQKNIHINIPLISGWAVSVRQEDEDLSGNITQHSRDSFAFLGKDFLS